MTDFLIDFKLTLNCPLVKRETIWSFQIVSLTMVLDDFSLEGKFHNK